MCSVEKRGGLYSLTLTGYDEHRLNPALISAVRSSLAHIKSEYATTKSPSVLITTAHGKFFSNGYDLNWAHSGPATSNRRLLMTSQFRALINDLITLPMPTIAAVTGHAAAAGIILALSHDYIFMRRDRGFLYMSELDIGLKIPAWFQAIIRYKVAGWRERREMLLRARKLKAVEAVETGLVDMAVDTAEGTVEGAVRLGEELVRRGWNGEVYGEIRKGLLNEAFDVIGFDETVVQGDLSAAAAAAANAGNSGAFRSRL